MNTDGHECGGAWGDVGAGPARTPPDAARRFFIRVYPCLFVSKNVPPPSRDPCSSVPRIRVHPCSRTDGARPEMTTNDDIFPPESTGFEGVQRLSGIINDEPPPFAGPKRLETASKPAELDRMSSKPVDGEGAEVEVGMTFDDQVGEFAADHGSELEAVPGVAAGMKDARAAAGADDR